MTISRRQLILGSAAALAATRANAMITLERNKPRDHGRRMTPLSQLEPHTRAEMFRREAWHQQLERTREQLYAAAVQAEPGALYRYLHFSWTHMHPTWEWPEWYAEQLEAIRWGYKQIGREPMEPQGKYFILDREAELQLQRLGLLGQIIVPGGPGSASAGVVAGAFHVWPGGPGASDSNNGILVADGGTGPWSSWSRFVRAVETPEVSLGDTVYLHAGTYVPTTRVHPTGGGTSLSSLKISVEGLPGDLAMIDFSVNNDTSMTQAGTGRSGIVIESANYRFRNLSWTSYKYGFGPQNGVRAMGCEFLELTRRRAGASASTGNIEACICIDDGSNNNDFLIEGCDLSDGNQISGNGNTVYVIHARGTVRNNLIGADTNQAGVTGTGAGYPLHIKRMNNSSTLGNLTVENNIIGRYAGTGNGCIYYNNTQYGLIQHNCFSAPGDNQFAMSGSDTGEPSNWPWYRNQLLHNTTRRSGSNAFGLCIIDNNNASGNAGTENTVRNNAIDGRVSIMPNQNPKTHNNVFDYQLYANSGSYRQFSTTITSLAAWRQSNTYMPAPDLNSYEELMVWARGFDQWNPAAYALGSGSAGIGSASDGTNIGANTSLVGPSVVRPNPPTNLVAQ